jgi:hypothetical protein
MKTMPVVLHGLSSSSMANVRASRMTYRLVQLAAGAYDLEVQGKVIASVVRCSLGERWSVELIDESLPHPPPFTGVEHHFESLGAIVAWLDDPELVLRRGARLRRTRLS